MKNYSLQFGLLRSRALQEPDNPHLFKQLLVCMEVLGNYAENCALYQEIIDQHPYAGHAWFNLGLAFRQLGRNEEALDALEYAYITLPFLEEAYHEYADLARETGRFNLALQCFREMTGRVEPDSEVLARMSVCNLRMGNIQIAKDLSRRSLQLNPYNADAYYCLGECFATEKDYQPAARWLREAIRNEDEREEFHAALAEVYGCLGNDQAAIRHYWRAIEIAPEDPSGWTNLAGHLLIAGMTSEALEVLHQAQENTCCHELLYRSAACLFLLKQRKEAISQLEKALLKAPGKHQALFQWAPALAKDPAVRRLIDQHL